MNFLINSLTVDEGIENVMEYSLANDKVACNSKYE